MNVLAEKSSISEVLVNVFRVAGGVARLTGQRIDPFHHFTGVIFVVFAHNLLTFTFEKLILHILWLSLDLLFSGHKVCLILSYCNRNSQFTVMMTSGIEKTKTTKREMNLLLAVV